MVQLDNELGDLFFIILNAHVSITIVYIYTLHICWYYKLLQICKLDSSQLVQLMLKGNSNTMKNESRVKVIVRVRPMISREAGSANVVTVAKDEQSVTIAVDEYNQIQTKFDRAISEEKSQKEVFMNIQPQINEIIEGYNLTIFAYGQTGSGKTFTMFGKDWENNFDGLVKSKKSKQNTPLTDVASDDYQAGIIPRSAFQLFNCLQMHAEKYNVFCSFLQIYNEKIYDLLQDSPKPNALNVHQSKFDGIFVEGLGEFQVHEYTDCLELMRRGEKNRFIRQTSMNAKSSRSHTIFQVLIQSTGMNTKGVYTRARLNLCDLAGSQKINKGEHMQSEHLQELKNINLSLTTLGKVINSLSKGPYKNTAFFRQSKLTRLLQQSLVGNTNTFIIGAISPSSKCNQQTINTLKFVERAKHVTLIIKQIKLQIKQTTISSQSTEVVQKLQLEMQQLKRLLQQKQKAKLPKQIEDRLCQLQLQNRSLKEQKENKNSDIENLIQENRRMKQALARMERVALNNFSESGLSLSSDQSEYKPKIKSGRPAVPEKQLPIVTLFKRQSPPPAKIPRGPVADRTKQKRQVITKLQNIENVQKSQQIQLMKDLDVIHQEERIKTERVKGRSLQNNDSYPLRQSYSIKPKRKIDYSQKIRELESRLKG